MKRILVYIGIVMTIICSSLCFFMQSCTHTDPIAHETAINVDQRSPAATIFSDSKYAILETSDNCILSDVNGIQCSADMICIQCGNMIYIFNHEGKFLNEINHLGLGPVEYISITDFRVRDNAIWILSSQNKSVYAYKQNGEFISKIQLDQMYASFDFYDDDTIVLASESSNDSDYNFVFFNLRKNSYIARYDHFEKNESFIFDYPVILENDKRIMYVTHPFDHTVYRLTEELYEPYEKYTFNTKKQLPEESGLSYFDLYKQTLNKNVVSHITMRHNTVDYTYLIFPLFGKCGLIYDIAQIKDGKQTNFMALGETIDSEYPYLSQPLTVFNDMLVSVLDASSVLYIEENNNLDFFSNLGLKDDDNPVVFMHKLR